MQRSRILIDLVRAPGGAQSLSLADWDALLRLARRANLIGRLAEGVEAAGILDRLPEPVQPHLGAAVALARHQRQAIVWEARHIASALRPLGIPVVLLKGAAYALADLRAARGRLFGDVDVLVPRDRLMAVEKALMMNGWGRGRVDPYDDRYYRQWMHELPPLVNARRGTLIDVHHNILPHTARHAPSAQHLLGEAVPLAEPPLHVLDPCDMVIHSATHLFHEGELANGLRDLLDLEALVTEFSERSPDFIERLHERARTIGLERPLYLAFRYMSAVLGADFPGVPDEAYGQGRLSDRWLDVFYLRGFKPDHPLCGDLPTTLARLGLYLRGHYLRMPPVMLARHLARKAVMRAYKNTSRAN